jgi:secondary thiamine-phosphate synthase enzyme
LIFQDYLTIQTPGRGSLEITNQIQEVVKSSSINTGICHLFIAHTSASLIICENVDPTVRDDLERFMTRLVPDGDPMFHHTAEGPDDMPAHIRSILTHTSLTIPISQGQCDLGTWQGIYLWEHRTYSHNRKITVTIYGE